jgi:hypothetical protein
MPIDVTIQYSDGNKEMAYIPLYSMFGAKPEENKIIPRIVYEPWKWTNSLYEFEVNHRIHPSGWSKLTPPTGWPM